MSDEEVAKGDRSPALEAFIEKATPAADLEAQRSLATLEARLFGRATQTVTVGRYVLGDRIASGGGGTVYRAHDPEHDRDVAIKLLHAGHEANRPEGRARLVREAQLLSRIAHPNIVEIYDVGTYDADALGRTHGTAEGDQGVFIAMELIEGSNLATWLVERRRDWTEVRDVFVAAGRGLAAAHAAGLVHRDFKPANVLVGRSSSEPPQVRVLDFGLGRATAAAVAAGPHAGITATLAHELEQLGRFDMSLTMTGALLGTPAYMAPEQHAAERADARSDQYSFCLAMYEGLCGCSPFVAATAEELESAKRSGEILPPPAGTRIPPHVEAALRRGLSPDPAERWPDMNGLLEALERKPPRRRRRWVLPAAVGTAVAAVATVAVWPSSEAGPCTAELERVAAVWSPRRVDAVRDAFIGTDRPFAADSFHRLHARVEAWVEAWTTTVSERCRALRGTPVPDRSTLECLDAALDDLNVTLEAMTRADAAMVERAIDIFAELRHPSTCAENPASDAATAARRALHTATALSLQGRTEAAIEQVEHADALLGTPSGPPHPLRIEIELMRRELLDQLRPAQDASAALESVLALAEDVHGPRHPRTADVRGRLAQALRRAGRHEAALPAFEEAIHDLEALPEMEHRIASLRVGLGETLLAAGHARRAIESFELALKTRSSSQSKDVADAYFGIARALRESGQDEERATELAERARDAYLDHGDRDAVARVEAWLSAL